LFSGSFEQSVMTQSHHIYKYRKQRRFKPKFRLQLIIVNTSKLKLLPYSDNSLNIVYNYYTDTVIVKSVNVDIRDNII